MSVLNKRNQILTRKLFAFSAMLKALRCGTFVYVTFTPKYLAFLLHTTAAVKLFFELTGITIRSAFSLNHAHFSFVSFQVVIQQNEYSQSSCPSITSLISINRNCITETIYITFFQSENINPQ